MLKVNLKKCSRCHAEFHDMIAAVKLDLSVFRLNASGVPEQIANLDQESYEYLCKDCFDAFANVLEQMNLSAEDREALMNKNENCCSNGERLDEKIEEDAEYDD